MEETGKRVRDMVYQKLTNKNINEAAVRTEGRLAQWGVEPRNVLKARLAAEETLLKFQAEIGEDGIFTQKYTKYLNSIRLEISVPGSEFDPFALQDETGSEILRGLLSNMGAAPVWQYKNGVNRILFFSKKKKRSQLSALAIAVLSALLCGGLCRFLAPQLRQLLAQEILSPLLERFMGFLTAIAGPMVFLSVVWGIYSIGDTAALGKIGKRMTGRFLLMSVFFTMISGMLFQPFFSFQAGTKEKFDFSDLYQMILEIVPGNFFTPFTEGNPMQIIFVAVVIGMALLILGTKVSSVVSLMEQANTVVQTIMEAAGSFVPLLVFGSLLNMLLGSNFYLIFQTYKILFVMLLGDLLLLTVYVLLVCTRRGVSPPVLLKKLLPTFLTALATASSSAAFSMNMECCEKDLGIDPRIVRFGVPLGQVVYMPGVCVMFLAAGFCMAEIYHVTVSPVWMVTALLIAVVLAVAAPPVPGGALTCYTILFVQLGIPSEAIAVTIALNVILEFFTTAVNLSCLQMELVELAASLDMLELKILREKKK